MENNDLKNDRIKNFSCYYFVDIIKLQDLDLDSILIVEKSHKFSLIYDIQNYYYFM